MTETVLDLANGGAFGAEVTAPVITRATDPVISPQPYSSPADFSAQYPTPLDTTEIMDKCEEISMWKALPEIRTGLKVYTWREMNSLAFTSGSAYIAFADGACPEEYVHDGENMTVTLKNLGAKKSLSISDIMHSQAVAGANWNGINTLIGPFPSSEGMPGGMDLGTFQREIVRDVKEKEVRLAMTLVLNGWDRLLIQGDSSSRTLEFDGIENWASNTSCSMHTNSGAWATSGTLSATTFDRWLAESCAKQTHIAGTPQAIQELLSAYYQLGFAGSQVVNHADGDRIIPGFNFASFVNTGIGRLTVIADNNFTSTAAGAVTQVHLWALRMYHNGEPLVYKITQIPLAYKDLAPGCTAISFEVWTKTALVIKACCAHGDYTTQIVGNIVSTCGVIG